METNSPVEPRPRTTPLWQVIAAIALCGAGYFVSIGLGEFSAAAWVAPIPILLLAFRSSVGVSAFAAVAAYYIGGLNLFVYLAHVMPAGLVAVLLLLPSIGFAASIVIARYALHRLPAWAATFAFPLAWTVFEYLSSLVSPHGTAVSQAYSQTDVLPLLQIASVTGLWGITFVLALLPSTLAVAWVRREIVAWLPAVVIAVAVVGYGNLRLAIPQVHDTIRIGLAATDLGIGDAFASEDRDRSVAVANAYRERILKLAKDGAILIVLPEKLVGVTPSSDPLVRQVFADAARDAHATVVAGLNEVAVTPMHNVAVVFGADGSVLTEYEKHHLLPGAETGYGVGASPGVLAGPRNWGVAICKDMDFPAWSAQYGRRGVRLMAVPAWDFVRDGRLHARMAVMRAVENGFAMARVAQQGNLTFSDAFGRILSESSSAAAPDALLVFDVPPGPEARTIYTRYGDWFGVLCVTVLIVLLFCARLFSRPTNDGP